MSSSNNRGRDDFEAGRPPSPPDGEGMLDPLFGTKAQWEKCAEDYEQGYNEAQREAVQEYIQAKNK